MFDFVGALRGQARHAAMRAGQLQREEEALQERFLAVSHELTSERAQYLLSERWLQEAWRYTYV